MACGVLILSNVAYSLAMLPGTLYFQSLKDLALLFSFLQEYPSVSVSVMHKSDICLLAAMWASRPLSALPKLH